MEMQKWYLLKLFQEWGHERRREEIKENSRRGEFKYDILDTL
jgi:hypothetical protein